MQWRLAEAKNRFSELVNKALSEGPQRVQRRNDVVIVLALRDYERLIGKQQSFKEFIMGKGPIFAELDLTRDRSPMRDVNL